ncbi:MAG: PQQ-binding-like beta-propeller repeat protein [Planctomycetota bacterium]
MKACLRILWLYGFVAATGTLCDGALWGGEALISLRHEDAEQELAECRAMLASAIRGKGSPLATLVRLQELNNRTFSHNHLLFRSKQSVRGVYRSYVPLTETIIDLLRSQPPEVVQIYRREYDLEAQAFYEYALRKGGLDLLLEVPLRYPIARCSAAAALDAGDLLLEQGYIQRAAEAWQAASWNPPRALEGQLRKRRELLESTLSRVRIGGSSLGRERRPSGPVPAMGRILGSPFSSGRVIELAWVSETNTRASWRQLGKGADYLLLPCVQGNWAAVSSYWGLRRFDLETGQEKLKQISLPAWREFVEEHPNLRLGPVADEETLITSYVAFANPKVGRGRGSGVIKVSVPRRALHALSLGRKMKPLWDTAQSPSLASKLSFNSPPVIHGSRVFALGWRQSGYVDVFLVCLDRSSGNIEWVTLLVSNDVAMTRFGEFATEPFLGELLVEGGVVYASTNLGVLAAVEAHDGSVRWLTEYFPVRPPLSIHKTRRLRYPYHPKNSWERCPIVSYKDRIIVTPQDTWCAFAVEKETGKVLERRKSNGPDPSYLLGRVGDELILAQPGRLTRLPIDSITSTGREREIAGDFHGRPALVRDGVIYASPRGLHLVPLDPTLAEVDLYLFSSEDLRWSRPWGRSRNRRRMPLDGAVTVFQDGVLVTNSYLMLCYREQPRE